MVTAFHLWMGLVVFTIGERLFELGLSHRNAKHAFKAGAIEVGKPHYRFMTVFHSLFFVAMLIEVTHHDRTFPGVLGYLAWVGAIGAQALRYWAIHSLGRRWNTRIIVFPESEPITRGPYQYIRHPNYVAVGLEMLCLPMAHGAYLTAIVFFAINLVLLRVRIKEEEFALGKAYSRAFEETPRFIPGI